MTTQINAEEFNAEVLNNPPCDLWEFYGSNNQELFLFRLGGTIHQVQRGEANSNYSYYSVSEGEFNTLFALQSDADLAISTFDSWLE